MEQHFWSALNSAVADISWTGIFAAGIRILFIVVFCWLLWRFEKWGMLRLKERLISRTRSEDEPITEASKRVETMVGLLRNGLGIGILVLGIVLILAELGVNLGPILAGAGVMGLAVGFGAQNLVRDVISGFFILLEDQMHIGDVVSVNGVSGVVERMKFRTSVIRDFSGTVHTIPNGTIEAIANMTKDWSGYVMNIGVAYKEDVDEVIGVMRVVGEDMSTDNKYRRFMIGKLQIFGLDSFGDSAVNIKARLKTTPGKQWELGREYQRRLKIAFDAKKIEIPFPQMTLHNAGAGN